MNYSQIIRIWTVGESIRILFGFPKKNSNFLRILQNFPKFYDCFRDFFFFFALFCEFFFLLLLSMYNSKYSQYTRIISILQTFNLPNFSRIIKLSLCWIEEPCQHHQSPIFFYLKLKLGPSIFSRNNREYVILIWTVQSFPYTNLQETSFSCTNLDEDQRLGSE